jgi:hypothetical protein
MEELVIGLKNLDSSLKKRVQLRGSKGRKKTRIFRTDKRYSKR